MARSDIDNITVKRQDGQDSFEGGMNWIDSPNQLQINQSRFLLNVDVRRKDLEKAKGQRPFSEVEIGAEFYDRFFADVLSSNRWLGFNSGTSSTDINDDFKLELDAGAVATTSVGVISQRISATVANSYMEFEFTTHSVQTTGVGFIIYLGASDTALATDDGLSLHFNEDGTLEVREDASVVAVTQTWTISTEYRIRFEKQSTGWRICLVALGQPNDPPTTPPVLVDSNDQVAETLYTGTFEGNVPSFLTFQPLLGAWFIDDVTYHEGFGTADTVRQPANGLVRFYREFVSNQTIVFAFGNMYKYTDTGGFTIISAGFNPVAKFRFRIFNDELFATNGVDRPIRYDGTTVQQVGAGETQAPVATFIEVHLQSLWLAEGNTLFRNQPGNISIWDEFEPIVDVDAWNGDVITGLVKLGSSLFIIKTSSVWELSGTLSNNFVLRRIPGTRGCIAPDSIATDGQRVFFRGIDGVYLFTGARTLLVSYLLHPAFNKNVPSPFETTVFTEAAKSVGIIHDYKYRMNTVQHGEPDVEFNNYEYVYDFIQNAVGGAWTARDRRNVTMYSSWIGEGDENELLAITSDTSNTLMELEVEDGNTSAEYSCVTINRTTTTPFIGKWISRNLIAKGNTRDFLEKTWSPIRVHYTPHGEWHIGIKLTTANNLLSILRTFEQGYLKNSNAFNASLDGGVGYTGPTLLEDAEEGEDTSKAFYLDDTKSILLTSFIEEEFIKNPEKARGAENGVSARMGNANLGIECVLELTQDQTVRNLSGFIDSKTPTGLRTQLGNFEPFRITRVLIGIQEEARRGTG